MKTNKPNIKAVIVEDEPWAAQNLQTLVKKLRPNIEIVNTIESVNECIKWFASDSVDLVFMDIHLADGSSFEIFEKVQINSPIIFTTAYDQYAIKAFKVNSIDYLLKPIKEEELDAALEKYEAFQPQTAIDFNELAGLFTQPKKYKQRFTIQAGAKIKTIPVREIALFYVLEGEPFLFTTDNHNYDLNQPLEKLELMLDPETFFRINRQMIVNFNAIDEMYFLSKSRMGIKLKPGFPKEILVSFRKMPEFREWIER